MGGGVSDAVSQAAAAGERADGNSASVTSDSSSPNGDGGCVGDVTAGVAALSPAAAGAASAGGVEGVGGGGGGDSMDDSIGALEEVRHQVAEEYLPVMATIRDQLIAELKGIDKSEVSYLVW